MPPKKKSTRKKGKKKETDEAKKAWAADGRKDAKGLAKALPETAQGLKSGDVDVKEAAAQLTLVGLSDRMEELRSLPIKENPNETRDWVIEACVHLALKVFPRHSSRELMAEFSQQLYDTLRLARYHTADARGMTEFYLIALQEAFDQVATEWEPRIRRMTRRQLTETCDVYKVSREAFLAFVHQFLEERFDTSRLRDDDDDRGALEDLRTKHVEMLHVAESLARGDDDVGRTCWCCGKHDRATSNCSKCHAARYCSRDCQVKSWKGGHKNVCAELKTAYEGFTNDLKRVDKAMEEGVAGIQPTPRLDYVVMPALLTEEHWLEQMLPFDVFEMLPRPSMDVFYQNLTYIINGGDHWLFEDTPNPSFAEGSFMEGRVGPVTTDEARQCQIQMILLARDISDLPEDKRNKFKDECLDCKQFFVRDGCTWTAERLLQIYSTFDSQFDLAVPRGAKESRTECVVEVLKWFMKVYNSG